MDGIEGGITLPEHERASQARHDHLAQKIHELKTHETKEETTMSTPVNVFTPGGGADAAAMIPAALMAGMSGRHDGSGAAMGGGLGAGLVGGLLGGLLFGGNGLNNRRNDGDCVTPMQLTSGLASVIDSNQNTVLLQSVGDVKAAVPLAEAQVQLALAGAQNDITTSINASTLGLMQGQFSINKNVSDTTAQIIAAEVATQNVVQTTSAGVQTAIANLGIQNLTQAYALNTAIRDGNDRIIAKIDAVESASLNRQLAVAEAALLEQRAITRSAATEVNVTQTVTQNQVAINAKQQQQQQLQAILTLAAEVRNLANDVQVVRQTQSNVVFGNQTGSSQTASAANNKVG